jgi:hypothetical protein
MIEHVSRTRDRRNAYKIVFVKSQGKEPTGKRKRRIKDGIKEIGRVHLD